MASLENNKMHQKYTQLVCFGMKILHRVMNANPNEVLVIYHVVWS